MPLSDRSHTLRLTASYTPCRHFRINYAFLTCLLSPINSLPPCLSFQPHRSCQSCRYLRSSACNVLFAPTHSAIQHPPPPSDSEKTIPLRVACHVRTAQVFTACTPSMRDHASLTLFRNRTQSKGQSLYPAALSLHVDRTICAFYSFQESSAI